MQTGISLRVLAAVASLAFLHLACGSDNDNPKGGTGGSGGSSGAGGSGGSGGCGGGSGNVEPTTEECKTYSDCTETNCKSQVESCFGTEDSRDGAACKEVLDCAEACPCDDAACAQACFQKATSNTACTQCALALALCVQGACREEATACCASDDPFADTAICAATPQPADFLSLVRR